MEKAQHGLCDGFVALTSASYGHRSADLNGAKTDSCLWLDGPEDQTRRTWVMQRRRPCSAGQCIPFTGYSYTPACVSHPYLARRALRFGDPIRNEVKDMYEENMQQL